MPGVLALCVISSAFTAQAIATGFDRRYAVLRYLGVTPWDATGCSPGRPWRRWPWWPSRSSSSAASGWSWGGGRAGPGWSSPRSSSSSACGSSFALALVLAGLLRAEGVLAVANLLWVLFLVLGGVIVPQATLSGGLAAGAGLLPSAALADGLRAAYLDGSWRSARWGPARLGRGRDRCGVAHVPVERLRVAHGIPLAVVESGT